MGGWNATGHHGWIRRDRATDLQQTSGRWTVPDIGVALVAFLVHWELCVAFIAVKLWHQASGYEGNVFAFVRDKWESLVAATRSVMTGTSSLANQASQRFGTRSSGNHAFDAWRNGELDRIEAERAKLRAAEREFSAYRDELLHAKDEEHFERFMSSRGANRPR